MSPEFSQGSSRPPIFDQGSDSSRPSESYSSGRGQHPPGFLVPPEGGSAENVALDCKFQELIRAFHSVQREVREKKERDQAYYQRWQRMGLYVEPYVSLAVHHWSRSGLGLGTLSGLRLLSQADALRRPRLQGSSRGQLFLMARCRRGSLPVLSMTLVVGALVSHLLHHTQPWGKRGDNVSVTGVRCPGRIHILASWGRQWNLLLGTSYSSWEASPGIVPAGGFRVSGIRSLVPWPGSGAQGSRASGWGTASGVPCPSSVCWGSTAWAAPHCRFAACACARALSSQSKTCRRQKKKSAAEKAEERADKECWRCRQLGHYEVDCPQPADEPMETAHGDALVEVTPMEVSPGPSEPGRPVEGPASSSLETSSRPVAAGKEEDQSREERARQAARACVATAHRSQWDMAGVSLDQTLSSATGRGLTVEAAASSDSRGSGRAGQLSVLKLAAATRRPSSRSERRDMGRRRARSLTCEFPAPTSASSACSSVRWRPQGYVSDPEVTCRADERAWGIPGGYRSTSGAILALLWSGDGFRDPSDDCAGHRGFVLRSAPGGVLQGWSCPPSQCDGDASGVAPGGRLSPVSPHKDRLLDSDAAVASERSGQAPGPAQDRGGSKKTQASPSSMSRATLDYSRCP